MVHFPFPRGHSPEKFSFLSFQILCIYFGLCWVFLLEGFSLVEASGVYSLVKVHRLLIVVTSVAERGLWSTGSVVEAQRLSCSAACRIFHDQGSSPCLLRWQVDSLPPRHQGGTLRKR